MFVRSMRSPRRLAALAATLGLALAACGSDAATGPAASDPVAIDDSTAPEAPVTDPTDPTPPSRPEPTDPAPAGSSPISLPAGLAALAEVAVADLVDRLALDGPDHVEVLAVEEVTWRDRALGCPQPGMQYAQVLTDGTRIVLVHDGVEYAYHAGDGRAPFYCARPESPLD